MEPTVVDTSSHLDLIALMLVESKISGDVEAKSLWIYETLSSVEGGASAPIPLTTSTTNITIKAHPSTKSGIISESEVVEMPKHDDTGNSPGSNNDGGGSQVKIITHEKTENKNREVHFLRAGKDKIHQLVSGQSLACGIGPNKDGLRVHLSAKDVNRWNRAMDALKRLQDTKPGAFQPGEKARSTENGLRKHSSDLTADKFRSPAWGGLDPETVLLFAVCIPLSMIYGGIHLTAWNFNFPSNTEMLLWKISCFIIMTAGLSIVVSCLFYFCVDDITCVGGLTLGITVVYALATVIGFILARIYIVFEAFLSLRHVPIGVYAVVPWVQNIPHI